MTCRRGALCSITSAYLASARNLAAGPRHAARHAAAGRQGLRDRSPSAAIIDSQSVKTTEKGFGPEATTRGKKVKGRKRHIVVDTLGLRCWRVTVHPADIQDLRRLPGWRTAFDGPLPSATTDPGRRRVRRQTGGVGPDGGRSWSPGTGAPVPAQQHTFQVRPGVG